MYVDLIFAEDMANFAPLAKKLGNDCLILAKNFREPNEVDQLRQNLPKEPTFKICHLMQRPDSKELQRVRQKADFVAVQGNEPALAHFAVSAKGVDFLIMPFGSGKMSFDKATARLAAENNVGIVYLFSEFLNATPFRYAKLMKDGLLVAKLMKRFDVRVHFFSGAKKPNEMRSAEDLFHLSLLFGFKLDKAKAAAKSLVK